MNIINRSIIALLFTMLFIGPVSAINLEDVINSSNIVRDFKPSKNPLQFREPETFKIDDVTYNIRFFMFEDKKNPHSTFQQAITASGNLDTQFQPSKEMPGAIYVNSTEENKANGIYYLLSIGVKHGSPKSYPSIRQILDQTRDIPSFKSSPLAYPADPHSIIKIGDKKYQIRYFIYSQEKMSHKTFTQFVKSEKLEQLNSETMDHGYGPLIVFRASEEMKKKGVNFVLSLSEIKA